MATSISNLTRLVDSLNRAKSGGSGTTKSYVDARFYKPALSADGTCQSIIRFILPKNPDADPVKTVYSHKFEGMNGFFYDNCPTTVGGECPVCRANREAYGTNDEYEISKAKPRSRKQKFVVNIVVIKDGNTPENNGKVFLLELDKKLFEKVIARVQPTEGSIEDPCDIFSVVDGANFKYIGYKKTIQLGGKTISFTAFDNSSFSDPSPLDKKIAESIDGQAFDLEEFTDPSKFKSYGDLEVRFNKVMGIGASGARASIAPEGMKLDEEDPIATAFDSTPTTKKAAKKLPEPAADEEDADDQEFLNRLRNESSKTK
jgi:hypothetical protein